MLLQQLDKTDVLIVEGTLSACYLAVELAGLGQQVVVTCTGASLAPEINSTLRPWIDSKSLTSAPKEFHHLLKSHLQQDTGLLHLAKFTEALEDLLLAKGVKFYYRATPAALIADDTGVQGALLAGKFGTGFIAAPLVIEYGPHATLARSTGVAFQPRFKEGGIPVRQVVQHLGNKVFIESSRSSGIEIAARGSLVEYRTSVDVDPTDPFFLARSAVQIRRKIVETPAVADQTALRVADLPCFDPLWSMDSNGARGPLKSVKTPGIQGLLILSEAGDLTMSTARELALDPVAALVRTADLATDIASEASARQGLPDSTSLRLIVDKNTGVESVEANSFGLLDPGFTEPCVSLREVEVHGLPVLASYQAAICGGGTSGVAAAIETARSGLTAVCLEANGDLGGVNTVGGVPNYWYGRWSRYMVEHHHSIKRLAQERNIPWSLAQMEAVKTAGCEVLPLSTIAGIWRIQNRVDGVLVAASGGFGVVKTELIIDSTGDGDIAAWAGAPYTYGSERDEITLWSSFGKFRSDRKEASRLYFSVADQRSLRDTTRAIIASRRQIGIHGEGEYPQFSLVTRESRHITGREKLSYVDMVQDKRFIDSVLVFRSNVDIKGIASSDQAMCGFVERDFFRNWKSHIPYGTLLPQGLENVLVVGKAYSASHDALSMARMQADITDMGAVAGIASKFAMKTGKSYNRLYIPVLQQNLVQVGIMEPWDLGSQKSTNPESAVIESLVDRAMTGPLELDDQMLLLSGGSIAADFLFNALEHPSNDRRSVDIARMLACLGDSRGARILLDQLEDDLNQTELPRLWVERHRHHMPDHGWSPEPVYLINALALCRELALIPVLTRLVEKIEIDENLADYRFAYVHAVSYAMERLADPAGIDLLHSLLEKPALRNRVLPLDKDLRQSSDYVAERCAYLELCLSRALSRCGDEFGYIRLIGYLADQRIFLVRSALTELEILTGQSFGYDMDRWHNWLDRNRDCLEVKPYLDSLK